MHLFAKNFPASVSPAVMRLSLSLCLLTTAFGYTVIPAVASPVAQAAEPRVAVGFSPMSSPLLRHAQSLGRLDAQTRISAALVLPLRSQNQLAELIRRQYTPGDPLYHQFLKPQDFTARFGPTVADFTAVADFARAQGLTITSESAGRTLLTVSGPAATVESAFGVQMTKYRLDTGREVYANLAAPRLPRSIALRVAGVAGLNNLAQRRPALCSMPRKIMEPSLLTVTAGQRQSGALQKGAVQSGSEVAGSHGQSPLVTGIGSGTLGGLIPNDIKAAYSLSDITPLYGTASTTTATLLSGTSQRVGLYELDGYAPADIATYVTTYSLPTILTGTGSNLTNVLLGNVTGAVLTADGQSEVTLDIDMIFALAPTASVYVYEDDQTTDAAASLTLFNRMASDTAADGTPLVQVISCSWGIDEVTLAADDPTTLAGENTAFQQFAAQGQSVFCASGDNGAYTDGSTISVSDPASQPFATGVGGTTLSYTKPSTNATTGVVTPGTYVSEAAWGNLSNTTSPQFTVGSDGGGGGISAIWAKPTYQQGVGASPTRREVPDVALDADPNTGYEVFVSGVDSVYGGTSAAAPLWASYTALVNQMRAVNGLGTIGFLNPVIYPIGVSNAYDTEFHDITAGNNLFFEASPGYDDTTGYGSFIGDALLAALSYNANQGTGTATLAGTVSDAANPATVLAGATITVSNASTGSVVATTISAADGSYTLSVPSGIALSIKVDASTITGASLIYLNQTLSGVTLTAGQTLAEPFALNATHTYSAGLQMISAPFDYTGVGNFETLFGLTAAQADTSPRLTQWQPSLASYVFYPTAPADTLRLGQGYWVQFPANSYLHLAGTPLTTTTYQIPLKAGWNQIGDPFTTSAPLSLVTVLTTDGATEGTLEASHLVQPTLYSYSTGSNSYVALNVTTATLDPYVGYWVYAFQPATLNVTTGAPPPPV